MTKKKCSFCKKKLGLITFTCSCCEGTFCVIHQTTHAHKCKKKEKKALQAIETIRKKNPQVVHQKVEAC